MFTTTTTILIYHFQQDIKHYKAILLIHALQAHHGILRILDRGAQLTRPRDTHQRPSTPLYTSETIQVILFRIFQHTQTIQPNNPIQYYYIPS